MTRTLRFTAHALLIASLTATAYAEPTGGPPAWNDKASVYLAMSQAVAEESATAQTPAIRPEAATATTPTAAANVEAAPVVNDAAVPAGNRYLAPPSARFAAVGEVGSSSPGQPAGAVSRRLAQFGVPTQSIYTILTALAIVIGAFLLFAWALKRGGRGTAGRHALPSDVVSVLGRVPLAGRQFAELLRVGNKLVLVSLTPNGAETLTEVTDPAEVDRLVGLCQQSNPYSTTKAFEHVFQKMSGETPPSGFLGNESMMTSHASPIGAYRANRGGTARG